MPKKDIFEPRFLTVARDLKKKGETLISKHNAKVQKEPKSKRPHERTARAHAYKTAHTAAAHADTH
jgi:hypothetical protein